MKLLRSNQNKDKDNVEKPIIYYYAKQIRVLGTNISSPKEKDAHVHIYEDRIEVELLKDKSRTIIPYKNMTDLQNLDAGDKVNIDRVIGVGVIPLWKRHHIITVFKYTDDSQASQIMAIDFLDDSKYAHPIIYKKMREVQEPSFKTPDQTIKQPTEVSIADEISKLAKLKEQGVITEEEFSQMKNNLMKQNIGKMYNAVKDGKTSSIVKDAKDVAKGILVAFIGIGFLFLAGYVYKQTASEIGGLGLLAIGIFTIMYGYKLAKGPKEVRVVD